MSHLDKIARLPRKPAAAERVAEQLKDLIASGNLKAGDLLPSEHDLAQALHVSRPVVREALRGLQMLGLVETRQGGRCSVTDLDIARLLQPFQIAMGLTQANVDRLFEARVTVECGLIALGAASLSAAALADLRRMVQAGHRLAADPVGFRVLDHEFHTKLMALAGNPFLQAAAKGLYNLGIEYRRIASESPGVITRSAAEHAAIVEAIALRDAARAAEAMRLHLVSIHRSTLDAMHRPVAAADAVALAAPAAPVR